MRNEALEIPEWLREAAFERDKGFCRVCGKHLGERQGLHHIHYGGDYTGMGGRRVHELDNIVTICWAPGDPARGATPCHDVVHRDKQLWVPVLETVVHRPAVTAFQLRRWSRVAALASAGNAPGNDDR